MDGHEILHEYYLQQHRNIENYLELCLNYPEVELVHELRLSIKKLRAFHKLAGQLFRNETDESFHIKYRVKQLYKAAGQLRDTQVQVHLLVSFEEKNSIEFPGFKKWLLRREKKRISRFTKKPKQVIPQSTTQNMHQKIGDMLALADDETILTGAGKVLTALALEARDLCTGTMNDRKLHHIRIITKQMRYILNIMHHSYPDFTFEGISVSTLREMEAAVGQWHDNLVRIELLDQYIKKMTSADNSENFKYQKLYNACKSELDISFNETSQLVQKALLTENSEIQG